MTADISPFVVAIIDDDATIRRLVRLFLMRSGFDVLEAASGEEGRKLLEELPWDLAILDRKLPDVDGLQLCQEVKADPRFRSRYIVMLTGEDEQHQKVEGLDLGADDYMTKPFQPAELLARVRAGKRIVDLQSRLMATNRRLEMLSITDGLTQVFNHRHFREEFDRTFLEAIRYERPLSLAMIDIDFFKKVNDTWGHATGDQVLRDVSATLALSVRTSDMVARYGGEEFAVMMPETSLSDASQAAEKIRKLVEEREISGPTGMIPVTVSIGVANFPHTQFGRGRELIEAADRALYRAKKRGRNQVNCERRREHKIVEGERDPKGVPEKPRTPAVEH